MKLTQITISMGRTVNTGNFNSKRADVSVTYGTDDEDFNDGDFAKAKTNCRQALTQALKECDNA